MSAGANPVRILNNLTAEQRDTLVKASAEWREGALETTPVNRERAETALARAYESVGASPPNTVLWLESPLSASTAAAMLTGLISEEPAIPDSQPRLVRDGLGALVERAAKAISDIPSSDRPGLDERSSPHVLARIGIDPDLSTYVSSDLLHEVCDEFTTTVGHVGAAISNTFGLQMQALLRAQPRQRGQEVSWGRAGNGVHDPLIAEAAVLRQLGVIEMPTVDCQTELARSCGGWWTYERLAILTKRPTEIHVDSTYWLHNEGGPALAYRDGVEVFAWHGRVGLPPKGIVAPDSLTLDDVDAVIQPWLREAMIERFGRDRYREQSQARYPDVPWITFRHLPGVGGRDLESLPEVHDRLDNFLHAIPYFLSPATDIPALPPRAVLNSVLRTGEEDAGMGSGANWEPFELSEAQYGALEELVESIGSMRILPASPDWVKTSSDLRIWTDELERGVPSDEHRRLQAIADDARAGWEASWDDSVREKDPLLVVRRLEVSLAADRAVQDLREGRPVGSSDAAEHAPEMQLARRARNAQLAFRAAERMGDPELTEHWRRESEVADQILRDETGSEERAELAKVLSGAIWRASNS